MLGRSQPCSSGQSGVIVLGLRTACSRLLRCPACACGERCRAKMAAKSWE